MENNTENKTFFRNISRSNVFWAIVSLALAILLWMYVTSTEGVEVSVTFSNVPIEFLGEDSLRESSGLIVTEQDRTSVNLTLSGARRVMNKLTSNNISATINLNKMYTDGRYSVSYDISYPADVDPDSVTVLRSSASVVNFYLDRVVRKTVPVMGDFTGNTAEGYMAADSLSFDPVVVTISGPNATVSQVDHAYVNISREGVSKTLSYSTTYDLVDADGNMVNDAEILLETPDVNVTLNVLSTRTVPLDVTVIDGGGATRFENAEITITPASIVLAGEAEVIDATTKLILGTIDLSSFTSDYAATYTIALPNGTENLTGVNEANVTVSIRGLSIRSFNIPKDNISCINVPEGYTAEIITQTINDVLVRAGEDVIESIGTHNLRAVADLSGITPGSGNVFNPIVKIYIDGFPTAGVVGEERIYVSLNAENEG
ncbi:MAG: hypothetical protein IKQ69_01060 [Oscillospiraceae bacterium]|nr:hypothetical protein [Oscillospiraceae bacterium]